MECLEEENYKFPVKVSRSSCNLGLHTQPTFMFTKINDGIISGDGRVLDYKRRLVWESVPTHHRGAVNPGFLRTRNCKVRKGSALALNWWPGRTSFYHWNRDVLPRAFVLETLRSHQEICVVAPHKLEPYHKHSLDQLHLLYQNVRIVQEELGSWTRYERVVVPRCNSNDRGSGFLHPEVADFVRWVNLNGLSESGERIPVLYLSRSKARRRRLRDERQLIEVLSEAVPLTVVDVEDLSYKNQLQLMSRVEILVGPFGAGLTNLLFTRRTALVEIHNGDSKETHFATLALACRSKYVQVRGGASDLNQDFSLGWRGIQDVRNSVLRLVEAL